MVKHFFSTKDIIIIALFAAILTAGKLALMAVPNVEIVTLLIMLYAVTFGLKISLPTTIIFCLMEAMIFGFNTWLITYFIYWPLLAVATFLASKIKNQRNILYAIFGGLFTILFGVISSAIDAIISSNVAKINFFVMFSIVYTRGVAYYLTHLVSNIIFITVAFPILKPLFIDANKRYYRI